MKITFKDDENVQNFSGKYDYLRSMDRRAMTHKYYYGDHYVMDNDSDFNGNNHCCCSSNQAMHTQYNHIGCRPRNCNCMASHGNISLGIPLPGYTPSAPPVPEYYRNPPPQYSFYSAFSEDNPSGCVIM